MQMINDRAAWIKAGNAHCSLVPPLQIHPYRFILLGAPGVGKGTQARYLSEYFGACHLSTGDIFRCAKNSTGVECGIAMKSAVEYMSRGELVPDETVLALVAERAQCLRCGGGFLLDGFPRTVAQARALEKLLAEQDIRLDAVLNFKLPLPKIIARLSGRRTCSHCKAVFHVDSLPPNVEGVCDHCGGTLFQREDDRPDAIRFRMAAFNINAAHLKQFYRRRNLLVTVEAAGAPEVTFGRALDGLRNANLENLRGVALPVAPFAQNS